MSKLHELQSRMKASKGIPALENTVNNILNALQDDKKSSAQLVDMITNDVSLTQKVLKLANSAMYKPFSNNTSTITDALRILGLKAILHLVLSALLVTEDELEEDQELSKILLASEFAKTVSDDKDTEDSAIVSLLYNVGRLLVSKHLKEEMVLIEKDIANNTPELEAEHKVLGMSLQDISIEMAKGWKLPTEIISVLDGTGDVSLINIAKFSNTSSTLIHNGKIDEANSLIEALDVPSHRKDKFFKAVNNKLNIIADELIVSNAKILTVENTLFDIQNKQFDNCDLFIKEIFPKLSSLFKTTNCLLFITKNNVFYKIVYGVSKNIDYLTNEFVINVKDKPNILQTALVNNVDINIADIDKLNAKSLPTNFVNYLSDTKTIIALPIETSMVIGLLYIDWDVKTVITKEMVNLVKETRAAIAKQLTK